MSERDEIRGPRPEPTPPTLPRPSGPIGSGLHPLLAVLFVVLIVLPLVFLIVFGGR